MEPFLRNLFQDPRSSPSLRLLSPVLGRLIARRRDPAVRRRYLEMGHGGACRRSRRRGPRKRLAALMGGAGRPDGRGASHALLAPPTPTRPCATCGRAARSSSGPAHVPPVLRRHQRQHARLRAGRPGPPPRAPRSTWWRPGTCWTAVATLAANAGRGLRRWAEAGADPQSCALIYVAHSCPRAS
ncbi:MAG: hypothetical protein IPM94_14005 [bacterium]|nr:hypothetical protein [bacterium]